jgi:hypothetical protein
MSDNFTFCEHCRDDVPYFVMEVPMVAILSGIECHYVGEEARCEICNSKLFVPKIVDHNLDTLYAVYHKKKKEKNNV